MTLLRTYMLYVFALPSFLLQQVLSFVFHAFGQTENEAGILLRSSLSLHVLSLRLISRSLVLALVARLP